jgi:hypothetical protein
MDISPRERGVPETPGCQAFAAPSRVVEPGVQIMLVGRVLLSWTFEARKSPTLTRVIRHSTVSP